MNRLKTHAAVIGSGIAGLSAALTLAEQGIPVIVLEKRKVIGGNSRFAAGIFSCKEPEDPSQPSMKELYNQIITYHRGQFTDPAIIRTYLEKAEDTLGWLKNLGVEFLENASGPNAGKKGTTTSFNVPKGEKRNGIYNVIQAMHRKLDEYGVPIYTEAQVLQLKKDSDDVSAKILGVEADIRGERTFIEAKAVILATGGFTGNKELLHRYYSYYSDDYEGHMIPHTGDGLRMAVEAGAALYDRPGMVRETQRDWAPSYLHFPLILALKQKGFVAVNQKGKRVISENFISNESNMTCNLLDQQPGKVIYILYDDALIDEIDSSQKPGPMGPLPKLKEVFRILHAGGEAAAIVKDLDEAAGWIGADPAVLKETMQSYNQNAERGQDCEFFRDPATMVPLQTPPYYVLKIGALMIDTIGPIRISPKAEVLNTALDPIPGLYCAGVAAGGWSSDDYCAAYQFGSCIGFSCNYGRVAGENAAEYLKTGK